MNYLVGSICIALIATGLPGSTGLYAQSLSEQMDSFIVQQMRDGPLPGISVGVFRKGKTLFERQLGTARSDQLFLLGNMSQPFTALMAMKMADRGLLDLDRPVRDYLPWFATADSISAYITVRHLLQHSSGLPMQLSFADPERPEHPDAASPFMRQLRKTRLAHDPGEDYTFCALNYKLLGLIIEKTAELSLDSLYQRDIWEPLSMKHTRAIVSDSLAPLLHQGYFYAWMWQIRGGHEKYHPAAIPATYIASDVPDMGRFLQAMIRSAVRDSSAVLCSPEGMQLLLSPFNTSHYGMGWNVDNWEGERMYFQQGLTQHFCSYMCFIPEEEIAVVLFANINNLTALEKINDGLLRILYSKKIPSYFNGEKYFRLLIFILLMLAILQGLLRLFRWSIQHWNFKLKWNYANTSFFVTGILIILLWLFVISNYFQMPIGALIAWQPDMGLSLVAGAAIGIINTFIQLIIRSNHHKNVKKRKQAV